jgi:hypothetical protein
MVYKTYYKESQQLLEYYISLVKTFLVDKTITKFDVKKNMFKIIPFDWPKNIKKIICGFNCTVEQMNNIINV